MICTCDNGRLWVPVHRPPRFVLDAPELLPESERILPIHWILCPRSIGTRRVVDPNAKVGPFADTT